MKEKVWADKEKFRMNKISALRARWRMVPLPEIVIVRVGGQVSVGVEEWEKDELTWDMLSLNCMWKCLVGS